VNKPHITIDQRWQRPASELVDPFRNVENGRIGNLGVWAALEHVKPGDVLVIATGDARERAVIGDLLAGFAFNSGAVAIVTDGMIRDKEQLDVFRKPVFAGGVCPLQRNPLPKSRCVSKEWKHRSKRAIKCLPKPLGYWLRQ